MGFDSIYGHQKQIKALRNAIFNKRVPNAYLFTGIDGIGKKTVAISLAKALNCLNDYGTGCDRCISCRKIEHGNHPDVFVIFPQRATRRTELSSETEAGKDTIRIEQVREVQRMLAFSIFEGRHRVLIFDQAEKMSLGASNCILKMLEEPPMRTLLILICRATNLLLPTIVSRCQKVYFNPLPKDKIKDAIVNLWKKDERMAESVAALSEGSLKRALDIMESTFFERRKEIFSNLLEIARKGMFELFTFCDSISKDREGLQNTLEVIKTLFRDILIWHHFRDRGLLMNGDLSEEIEIASSTFTVEGTLCIMEKIGKAQILLEQNINPRLLSEAVILEIRKMARASLS